MVNQTQLKRLTKEAGHLLSLMRNDVIMPKRLTLFLEEFKSLGAQPTKPKKRRNLKNERVAKNLENILSGGKKK
jgi:hypothetical protein